MPDLADGGRGGSAELRETVIAAADDPPAPAGGDGGMAAPAASSSIGDREARRQIASSVMNALASRARPSQLLGQSGGSSLLGSTMDGFWGIGQQAAISLVVEGKAPDARQIKASAVQIVAAAANQQMASLIDDATRYGQDNAIPFLRNLELTTEWFPGSRPTIEARTIDALFQSAALDHTLFLEAALRTDFADTTANLGLGYRYQLPGSGWMLGANAFYDRQFPIGHQRMSLGLEASTSDFTLFANRYVALSGWAEKNPSLEERPLSGWDVGIAGPLPHFEDVRVSLTAFRWEQKTAADRTGLRLMADMGVLPGLDVGGTFAADDTGDVEAGLRLSYQFGAVDFDEAEPGDGPDRDRRLSFVHRDNVIRTEKRDIPRDYTVAFTAGAVNAANETALSFGLAGAPLQSSFSYRITSSAGGPPVTGTGLVTGNPQLVSGIDVSGLADGTLTLTLQVTSKEGATGPETVTHIEKSSTALSVTVATSSPSPTNASPITFTIAFSQPVTGLEIGDLALTNGTAANLRSSDAITWTVDVTPLAQGEVALSVPAGAATAGQTQNQASNRSAVIFDNLAPSGYSVSFLVSPIAATAIEIRNAEQGAGFSFTITSSGGGDPVTGTGTISSSPQQVTGLDLSTFGDGLLTLSLTLTDALGNAGAPVTATMSKTGDPPVIESITPPDPGEYNDL